MVDLRLAQLPRIIGPIILEYPETANKIIADPIRAFPQPMISGHPPFGRAEPSEQIIIKLGSIRPRGIQMFSNFNLPRIVSENIWI